MFIAQANIARFRYPLDDPNMGGFAGRIDPLNKLAEQAEGFIWRCDHPLLPHDMGPPWDDPLLFFNMSVWRDRESLLAYVRSPEHAEIMADRATWLRPVEGPSSATWWIEETTQPSVDDAIAALSAGHTPQNRSLDRDRRFAEAIRRFIVQRERSVWQAVIDKDGHSLSDLFADDYTEITLRGQRVSKGTIVEESPQFDEIDDYSIDAELIQPLNSGTFLLSYHGTIDGTFKGEPILPQNRWITSIWRRDHGQWRCCFFQQSPYPNNA